MKILLTNDDGIRSPSLLALAERLKQEHEVWTVAPAAERSGCSHSISLNQHLIINTLGENRYSCSGTPADCVMVALLGLIKEKIELVISGPNIGANLGTDIIYSGTVAAARQAAFMQVPSIAASIFIGKLPENKKFDIMDTSLLNGNLEYVVEFLAKNLAVFVNLFEKDHFVNINFPPPPARDNHTRKVSITFPSVRIYKDTMLASYNQQGEIVCKITGELPASHYAAGSDYEAVMAGDVSISPIIIHPHHREDMSRYLQAHFWTAKQKP